MNVENQQWNKAEMEFGQWLKGSPAMGPAVHTYILKSTYLVFRQKESERLKGFCNKAFKLFRENEGRESNYLIQFARQMPLELESDLISEDEPLFSKFSETSEPEYREKANSAKNERIIQGILSGEQSVFNDLYEYEFPKVVRLVTRNSGSLDGAKDIFQDGLIILMEKTYRGELDLTCSLSTYLYSICRNLWMEQLRKDQKIVSFIDPYSYLVAEMTYMEEEPNPEGMVAVSQVIENLGDPCRQLLECYYYENLNWVEIANSLGYSSAASARNQKYKCLERIRKSLKFQV